MEVKKNILFISPAFFGYEISICDALKKNGYNVDYFDERISNNSFIKAVFRIKKNLLKIITEKYYRVITNKIKGREYDYFFLIKGEVVPETFIVEFKINNPNARLIYYTYDAISNNNKNSLYILKHFDDCYSFDFNDVKSNPLLKLKHLFYTTEYNYLQTTLHKREYTISFVGTLHSNRYSTIKTLFREFENTFVFFYSPAKWFFLYEKTLKIEYKNILWQDVSFDKLDKKAVASIFTSSKSVLDIQRFGQSGLTMRTFEVLASGAILVTTNTHIKEAEFYDPDYIVIINDAINSDYVTEIINKTNALKDTIKTKNPLFKKYFVDNWVKEFFQ